MVNQHHNIKFTFECPKDQYTIPFNSAVSKIVQNVLYFQTCINPYPNLFLTAVQKHLMLLVWPIQNRLVNGQRDWERLSLSEKRLGQYSCPFNMAEICHYESIYRHSAAGPFHLNYWFVHLFACLCASLGQIVSATFDEGVHLAVRKETRAKKILSVVHTLPSVLFLFFEPISVFVSELSEVFSLALPRC